MRAVIQRVSRASIGIAGGKADAAADGQPVADQQPLGVGVLRHKASIGEGLLVLLGIGETDEEEDIEWLSGKIVQLRIFNDADGVMNVSVKEKGGELLLVSQFTLHASTKKGNRPSYIRAARPETARPLYEQMILRLEAALGRPIHTGEFGADMKVELLNDGPVTIIIDTKNRE